jgi:L-rhamnonate dehydratase
MPETPAEAECLAHDYVAQGFTAMKFGWGPLGLDEQRDIELIAAARSGAGEAMLMIDFGQQYTAKKAIRVAERAKKYRLQWIEEPLPPDDFAGYRQLAASVCIDVAAGKGGPRSLQRLYPGRQN